MGRSRNYEAFNRGFKNFLSIIRNFKKYKVGKKIITLSKVSIKPNRHKNYIYAYEKNDSAKLPFQNGSSNLDRQPTN